MPVSAPKYLNYHLPGAKLKTLLKTEMELLKQNAKVILITQLYETVKPESGNNEIIVLPKLNNCVCCNMTNVPLIKLSSCSHTRFLKVYFNYRINFTMGHVCHYCHRTLKAIDDFKKKVQQNILNCTLLENPYTIPKLQKTELNKISIKPNRCRKNHQNIPNDIDKELIQSIQKPESVIKNVTMFKNNSNDTENDDFHDKTTTDDTSVNISVTSSNICLDFGSTTFSKSIENITTPNEEYSVKSDKKSCYSKNLCDKNNSSKNDNDWCIGTEWKDVTETDVPNADCIILDDSSDCDVEVTECKESIDDSTNMEQRRRSKRRRNSNLRPVRTGNRYGCEMPSYKRD